MVEPYSQDTGTWKAQEVGGDGGLVAGLMAKQFAHLVSTDSVSSQLAYKARCWRFLRLKFERNDETSPHDKAEFLVADVENLPFRDGGFDFCFSQNAFELIPDTEKALREMVRVIRPSGLIYLMFDPLWTADSGSHSSITSGNLGFTSFKTTTRLAAGWNRPARPRRNLHCTAVT